jgi:Holliday junction resolvasome RuvABC endonuclease subunit
MGFPGFDGMQTAVVTSDAPAPSAVGPGGILVLGVDPGPTSHGWALVHVTGLDGGRFVICGECKDQPAENILRLVKTPSGLLAIEVPARFLPSNGTHYPAVAGALMGTTYQAGRLASIAEDRGLASVEMTAADWRREVCGKGAAKDGQVAEAVGRLVSGWPKRSNAHVRDAAGVALAAGWAWIRKQVAR